MLQPFPVIMHRGSAAHTSCALPPPRVSAACARRSCDVPGMATAQGIFRRTQLKAMLDIHGVEEGLGGDLTADEIGIIRGALDLSHKTAATCMTPFDKARRS